MPWQVELGLQWGRVRLDKGQVTTALLDDLTNNLRYHPDGYRFSPAYPKFWDGYKYLFNRATGEFRAGLYHRVAKVLERHGGSECVLVGERDKMQPKAEIKLRRGAVRAIPFQQHITVVTDNHPRGIISSPTSTGKTVMMGLAIGHMQRVSLVILNDLTLLGQTQRSLERTLNLEVGIIGDGEFELRDVTCATVQSLCSILGVTKTKRKKGQKPRPPSPKRPELEEWLSTVTAVLHDEVHQADSTSCSELYLRFPRAERIYGFSATPYEWAEKQQSWGNIELEGVFGTMIYDTSDLDFISMGLKVPTIVRQVKIPASFSYPNVETDSERSAAYKLCVKQELVENELWYQTVIQEVGNFTRDGMSVFVYAAPNHGLEYAEKLAGLIPDAILVNGSTPRKKREQIFEKLHNKEILCVVSDIGGIGLDVQSLDVIALASDVVDIRQIRGRVERAYPGKEVGVLLDFWKDCTFLNKHHRLRLNQYSHGGSTVL